MKKKSIFSALSVEPGTRGHYTRRKKKLVPSKGRRANRWGLSTQDADFWLPTGKAYHLIGRLCKKNIKGQRSKTGLRISKIPLPHELLRWFKGGIRTGKGGKGWESPLISIRLAPAVIVKPQKCSKLRQRYLVVLRIWTLEFRICFGFRISCFEFKNQGFSARH